MTPRTFAAYIVSALASMAAYTPLRAMLIIARGTGAFGSEILVIPLVYLFFWIPLRAYAGVEDAREQRRAMIMRRVRRQKTE